MCRAACRRRSSRWKTPFNLYSIPRVKFHISCVATRASSAPGALVLRALLQTQLFAHWVSKTPDTFDDESDRKHAARGD